MIGESYWSTGIMLRWYADGNQWSISLNFLDDGFCDQSASEGTLKLRYLVDDLEAGINTLKADAERLGIRMVGPGTMAPTVYIEGDGEIDDMDYPPDWRELVNAQATRLGWQPCYTVDADMPY